MSVTKSNTPLSSQVMVIAEEIYKHKNDLDDAGLLGGKTGVALLFAYLSKQFPEKNYLDITFEYLDELGNCLSNEALPYHMSGGVAGIAFLFQHLRNIGVLEITEELNLTELDEFISHAAEHDFQSGEWDPLHGMVGLGIYFLERNKETGEKKYLEKIVDHLANMRTAAGEYLVWITRGFGKYSVDNYNFGMAHGMPGILSFLAQVYMCGIRQDEIKSIILSCMPWLLQHEYEDDPLYSFPLSIDVQQKEENESKINSRLAWCYGDLCMANALIHCGRALQNQSMVTKGISVALKTTRRSLEDSGCGDALFCHGTVGLAHQYNRFYQLTKNDLFKVAADNWIDVTIRHFYKPGEGVGGYYFRSFNQVTNNFEFIAQYGLLEGSAGIALVYLSYLYHIKPDWDIIFLTNV